MVRLLTILFLVISFSTNAQNIWVADNNYNAPTGAHVFTTLQEAVDAASDGDIVQVQPSPNVYGNVTINKEISLMGIGFNIDKDIPLESWIGDVTLTNNADNTSDADGAILTGLHMNNIYLGYNTTAGDTLKNILVKNCWINYIATLTASYLPTDNIEIRNCYITGSYSGYGFYQYVQINNLIFRNNLMLYNLGLASATQGANNIITNNIMYGGIYVNATGTTTTISNNNFIGQTGTESAFDTKLMDCIVSNNIFYGSTPNINASGGASANFERNVFTNNLVHSTGDDTMPPLGNSGTGNIVNSPYFVDVQLLNTWSSSYDFTLDPVGPPASPAIGAGSDGTDIGISGGIMYPFTESNFSLKTTAAPVIQILNTSTIINPGDDLPVRIKAKSN